MRTVSAPRTSVPLDGAAVPGVCCAVSIRAIAKDGTVTIWQLLGGVAFVVGALIEVYGMARSISFELTGLGVVLLAGGLLVVYFGRKRVTSG